jgi:MFS family permease
LNRTRRNAANKRKPRNLTPPPESYPWKLQGAVYSAAVFNGTVQPMATMMTALLVGGLISTEMPFLIALILASRHVLIISMSIYSGALMDRLGTRQIVIVFGLAGAAAAISYPLLPGLFGVSLLGPVAASPPWLLVIALILVQMVSGLSEGTNWIGIQTIVGRLFRGQALYAGRMTFAARIGGIFSPAAIGGAWDFWGPWGGFGFLAAWILCGVFAAQFLPRLDNGGAGNADFRAAPSTAQVMPKVSDYATTFRLLLVPAVALVVLVTVMRQTGSGIQGSFYVVWLDKEIGLSGTLIGTLLSVANALSAVAALMTGPLARYYRTHWLLIITIGLSIVGVAVTPALGNIYVLLLIAACARGMGQGLNLPLMMTILARNVATGLLGRVTALRISFNRLGGAVVPLIMGALAEVVGIANSFYIIGASGVIMLGLLSLWVAKSPSFAEPDPVDS